MADITTLENSVMLSQAKYMKWEKQWREEKLLPMLTRSFKLAFDSIPPEQKEAVKSKDPELYNFIKSSVTGA